MWVAPRPRTDRRNLSHPCTSRSKTKHSSLAFRERTFRIVHAAAETHSGEAGGILNQRYARVQAAAEGQSATDYRLVLTDLGGELEQARQTMLSANHAHLGQLALIVDLQKQRDTLNLGLFDRYYQARHTLESLFGRERGFEVLAVDGETPRDPSGLITQVRSTVTFLEEPKVELPSVDLAGVAIDLTAMARQLGSDADDLEDVLAAIERERKNAETTRKAKNDAIAEFDRHYLWVGRGLETYFHLAGMHEVAGRVRPSARRPGRRAADEDLESAELEAASDGEPTDSESPASEPSDSEPAGG